MSKRERRQRNKKCEWWTTIRSQGERLREEMKDKREHHTLKGKKGDRLNYFRDPFVQNWLLLQEEGGRDRPNAALPLHRLRSPNPFLIKKQGKAVERSSYEGTERIDMKKKEAGPIARSALKTKQ